MEFEIFEYPETIVVDQMIYYLICHYIYHLKVTNIPWHFLLTNIFNEDVFRCHETLLYILIYFLKLFPFFFKRRKFHGKFNVTVATPRKKSRVLRASSFNYAKIKHFSAPSNRPSFSPECTAFVYRKSLSSLMKNSWIVLPCSHSSRLELKTSPCCLKGPFSTFLSLNFVCASDGVSRDVLLSDVPIRRLGMSRCDDPSLGHYHGLLLPPQIQVSFN